MNDPAAPPPSGSQSQPAQSGQPAQPAKPAQPAPVRHWGDNAVFCVYDLAVSPVTFDFLQFLGGCESFRVSKGAEHIHVIITHGNNAAYRRHTPKDLALDDAAKMWRVQHILAPAAWQLKHCSGVSVYKSRLDCARFLRNIPKERVFPPNYDLNKPSIFFMMYQVCQVAAKGLPVQGMEADPACLANVDLWLKEQGIDRPIVALNLRQSTFESSRDCRIDDWARFAEHIRSRGFEPVAVPDTDIALTTQQSTRDPRLKWYYPGGLDVGLRLAMFRRAKITASFGGGPAFMNVFMPDTNFLIFMGFDVMPKAVPSKEAMHRTMGFPWGEQFPFASPTQVLDWRPDKYEHLVEAFDDLLVKVQAKDAAKDAAKLATAEISAAASSGADI